VNREELAALMPILNVKIPLPAQTKHHSLFWFLFNVFAIKMFYGPSDPRGK
jgi:hypothetical protein